MRFTSNFPKASCLLLHINNSTLYHIIITLNFFNSFNIIPTGNKYMLAFCVQKNWKALKYGGSADGGIFKCFQALRYVLCCYLFFSSNLLILKCHSNPLRNKGVLSVKNYVFNVNYEETYKFDFSLPSWRNAIYWRDSYM